MADDGRSQGEYRDRCICDVRRGADVEYRMMERIYADNDGRTEYLIEYREDGEPRKRINLLGKDWMSNASSELPAVSGYERSETLADGLDDLQTATIRFYSVAGFKGHGNRRRVNRKVLKMVKLLGTRRYDMHDFLTSLNVSNYGQPQPTWEAHVDKIKSWYKKR